MSYHTYPCKGRPRVVAMIMMTARTASMYTVLFRFLQRRFDLQPSSIMADWEGSSRKAAREVWGSVPIYGCNFHFCQALKRKAVDMGVFSDNTERLIVRLFMRLSLLPRHKIAEGLQAICEIIADKKMKTKFHDFHKYVCFSILNHTYPHLYIPIHVLL